ncbi:MAG: dTDP-4-dehydrorhamnose reductase [Acidobacteriota bacterium]|jgi:dTDP-4-dehydrorhamnose reductase|nr:dTDP-4-dehydrorhamnose reductase [Acidobacteriota bacterium]
MPLEPTPQLKQPELWAGIECTVNRVGDVYFDQLELSGHARRAEDLNLLAGLGVSAVRYPVLWERTAPEGLAQADWSWPDVRLSRLRELKLRPVVGLVHHGSGPRTTSLLDSLFPEKLARYARAVAARYPWVEDYTPVNEPLTTARFSGLYGHWYPHGRDALTFARALLVQVRAVVLSMRAVREVNARARLVQTEDLGKTFSTRTLNYQAEFENERRWLTYDLLAGRVGRGHAMWDYLRWVGVGEAELEWFVENPCPPDIVGVNHYITSERFIDERVARYPADTHGGNGRHSYADVEAVRVCAEGTAGPRALLGEVWERYRLPVAVTEVHLGCSRDEQLRWLKEVWDAARDLREEGGDVRAVTVWSVLGAFDWHNLLTRNEGRYEPGVYDLRAPSPRPTALASMLCDLAARGRHDHPVLDSPGWWRRLDRLCYPPVARRSHDAASSRRSVERGRERPRKLLITGATGTLGRAFARVCERRGLSYLLLARRELDIADAEQMSRVLDELGPWAVVNTAGYVRVDEAEREPELCRRENTTGAAALASACASRGVALLTFSSDLVFDGTKRSPYVEGDATAPLNVYGRSKAEAERLVTEAHAGALVVRTSAFFGPWDEHNFVNHALRALAAGRAFPAAADVTISPTYVPDLVHACLDLLIDGERGVWHLANAGGVTWAELARLAAVRAGLDASFIEPRPNDSFKLPARRPAYGVLASERGTLLPALDCALARYAAECETRWPGVARSAAGGR